MESLPDSGNSSPSELSNIESSSSSPTFSAAAATINFAAAGAFTTPLIIGHNNNELRKIRKNAADLSEEERNNFLLAIMGLKNKYPNNCKYSVYDQFVILHMGAVSLSKEKEYDMTNPEEQEIIKNNKQKVDPGHGNPSFLSWHRMLLNKFEKALQTIDPTVTLPYWDWTDRDASANRIFIKEFMGGNGGVDGLGGKLVNSVFTSENGFTIRDELHTAGKGKPSLGNTVVRYLGPFDFLATPQSEHKEFMSSNTLGPSSVLVDKQTGRAKPYDADHRGFRIGVEAGLKAHNPTHDWYGYGIGPQMPQNLQISEAAVQNSNPADVVWDTQNIYASISTMTNVACSNNDPIFWLHHCNIDRLWADWQDQGHYGDMYFPKAGRDLYPIIGEDGKPTGETYSYPYGHNLEDPLWPWDNSESFTPPWLQEGLPISYSYVTSKDVLDFRNLGYQYDTSSALTFNAKPVKAFPPNGTGRQVFKFTINSTKNKDYYFNLGSYGAARVNDVKIHKVYNKNDTNEWDFQEKGFDGDASLIKTTLTKSNDGSINKVKFNTHRGTYYAVVACSGDSDIGSYYTIAINDIDTKVLQTGANNIISFGLNPTIAEDGKIEPEIVNEPLVAEIKGTKEFKFIYVDRIGQINFKVEGIDALIQLIGPSNSNDIIGLDEGCCKKTCPTVSAILTPGHYLIQLFHCSFNSQVGQKGNLHIKYSTQGIAETKVKTIASGSSITEHIPESGTVLYKIKTDSNMNADNSLYVFRVGLHSFSSCSEVHTTVYKCQTKLTPDPFGFNNQSIVIASGDQESRADLPLTVDDINIEYYVRVSFPQAPHIKKDDKFTLKFKPF